jgi:hypothetical protein
VLLQPRLPPGLQDVKLEAALAGDLPLLQVQREAHGDWHGAVLRLDTAALEDALVHGVAAESTEAQTPAPMVKHDGAEDERLSGAVEAAWPNAVRSLLANRGPVASGCACMLSCT